MKNSFIPHTSPPSADGFTRVDLLAVLCCLALLAITQLPLLGRSREGGHEAVCMNNLRQLGLTMLMYSAENQDVVPNEGNPGASITVAANSNAWYNLIVPSLKDLYQMGTPPLPSTMSVFSCPSAPGPSYTPNLSHVYFVYGENARLCINAGTLAGGVPQTRFSGVIKPSDTVLFGEQDGYVAMNPSQSNVTGQYAVARHQGFGFFAMTDGHVRSAPTNEFTRTASESNVAAVEWWTPRTMYWYPTPNTPN